MDFDLKERVRSSVDIVNVVGAQMELRRQGQNFVALCPWHQDRRPSLMINAARQTWRCWVCDVGGDVFSWVMKRDGVTFPEALRILGEQAGIPIEELTRGKPATPGSVDDKTTLLSAVRWACDQYHSHFLQSADATQAREYASGRDISEASIEKFKIGFAPDSWDWLLKRGQQAGFSGEILHACGLATPRKSGKGFYDMFRNRLMFPIWDLQGREISMGGRVLPGGEGQGGKYINGPETRLFSKSKQIYGLNFARDPVVRTRQALVMEGYTDVIAAWQAGVQNAVAVLGTALGEHHIQILKRFADTIVLVLDGDQAGQRRADEVLELFIRADVDLRVMTLPDNLDPADYLKSRGSEAFLENVESAPDAIQYKLHRLTDGVDLTQETHRASKALEAMLGILAQSPVPIGDLKLQQTLVRLCRTFSIPQAHLQSRLEELRRQRKSQPRPRGNSPTPAPQSAPTTQPPSVRTDKPDGKKNHDIADAFNELAWTQGDDEGQPDFDYPFQEIGQSPNITTGPSIDPQTPRILEPVTGLDRELFEILIESPDCSSQAIEVIHESWLATHSARMILSVYQALELEGIDLRLENVLLAVENEFLKSQLVSMEDRAIRKGESATLPPFQRFSTILQKYQEMQVQAETQQRLAALDSPHLEEDEQLNLLDELFAAQRMRQGLAQGKK